MLFALAVFGLRKRQVNDRNKLLRIIKRKKSLRAIKMMNRRIYKKLRFTGKVRKPSMSDREYELILKKTYPQISEEDWKRYMEIVKAAAFSRKNFTVEEMEFCYEIYHKIIQNS